MIIIFVTVVTVATDLAIAVVVGVVMASLAFAWQTAKNINADEINNDDNSKEYIIRGPLFFGSSTAFKTLFTPANDPQNIIIDFKNSRVSDHSAIDAIKFIAEQYTRLGKTLHLRHLSQECKSLIGKAGSMIEVNMIEDPQYRVATDLLE